MSSEHPWFLLLRNMADVNIHVHPLIVCCERYTQLCDAWGTNPTSACSRVRLEGGWQSGGLQPSPAGGVGAEGQGPLSPGPSNKTQELSRPGDLRFLLCLYVEAVCGQSCRKPESERKATKGEGEEYSGSSGSKCSWKIKAPNKEQQNSKKANRRSKAREQNAGQEVSARELISQTYESLTLKQKYHSLTPHCGALFS